MDPITLLALGSGASSLIGRLLAKPRKPDFDPMEIYRKVESSNNAALNNQLSSVRAQMGASLGARGLSGGAAQGVIGNMEGRARGETLATNSRILSDLLSRKSDLRNQYNAQEADWLGGVFGDIGAAGGAVAGALKSAQTDKAMTEEELQFWLKRLNSLKNTDSNYVPRILAGTSNPTGGTNGASMIDGRRMYDMRDEIPLW